MKPLYFLIKVGDEDEIAMSCMAIWNLAFEDENKEVIFKDKELMDIIRTIAKSDAPYKKSAEGILFLYDEYENKKANARRPSKANVFTGHIMISYQWSNQSVLKHLGSFLKDKGYKIWMDIENMGGSTLQAMAEAVEESAIILICISEKYKESPNCRMGRIFFIISNL